MSREENKKSINEAIEWLKRSYEANSMEGISEYYSSTENWKKPSTAVTAGVAGLLVNLESCSIKNDFLDKSVELSDKASEMLLDCGAVAEERIDLPAYPSVLRTAQAVEGWIEVYRKKGNEQSIVSAVRAGEWLAANQDGDGSWRAGLNDTFGGQAKMFNISACSALAELWRETKIEKFKRSALNGLEWALSLQNESGWFLMNNSDPQSQDASLRNIGYTVLSLYNCGIIFERDIFLNSVETAVAHLLRWQRINGDFPGRFNHKNNPTISRHCCFGTAQIAKFCLLMYALNRKDIFLEAGKKAASFLRDIQELKSMHEGMKGAVPSEKNKRIFYAETVKEFIEVLSLD